VVSCSEANAAVLHRKGAAAGIAITTLGTVTESSIDVNGENWGSSKEWKTKYDTAIEKLLN
jgi:hypothetical protein